MPRCPECYRIVSHRRLDSHLEWCCSTTGLDRKSGAEPERLAHRLTDVERRIGRRIDAIEAELDRLGTHPTDGRDPIETEDLTPPPT